MSGRISGVDFWWYYGGKKFNAQNWTMDQAAGITDITDFHSSGGEAAYTGLVDVTGTISGIHELYDTSTGGTVDSPGQNIQQMFAAGSTLASGLGKAIESSKSMWYGTVFITGFSKNQPAQGHQGITYNWRSSGRMSWSSDTTTST